LTAEKYFGGVRIDVGANTEGKPLPQRRQGDTNPTASLAGAHLITLVSQRFRVHKIWVVMVADETIMGHYHSFGTADKADNKFSPQVGRAVLFMLIPLMLCTGIGLVVLWPDPLPSTGKSTQHASGVVNSVNECVPETPVCQLVEFTAIDGPYPGKTFTAKLTEVPGSKPINVGTEVWLTQPIESTTVGEKTDSNYGFSGVKRTKPVILLVVIFSAAVILLSRWKGVAALAGLVVSLGLITQFLVPGLAQGASPLPMAAVGASAIAIATMGLAHGFTSKTGIALIGTICALLLTIGLGSLFSAALSFTGVGSEEAFVLQNSVYGLTLNFQGLFLAGLVVGALGVLDDVTVTQVATVWEVHRANPKIQFREAFQSGMRVGRDHVAATVNTLVLAYVGASLPLLLLLTLYEAPFEQSVTGEVVAQEIVRSLVGGLGIIAAVPITTLAAAWAITRVPVKRPTFVPHSDTIS